MFLDRSVSIVTGLRVYNWGIGVRFPPGARDFFLDPSVQTDYGLHSVAKHNDNCTTYLQVKWNIMKRKAKNILEGQRTMRKKNDN